ncbi:uncharacterized protein [Macrobrachium rosenbergii]|uniref:uncharacterized protein n=1 Tax=Macrobrachium rosenbergii TaxID=79674 RepID=UPI0034D75EEA
MDPIPQSTIVKTSTDNSAVRQEPECSTAKQTCTSHHVQQIDSEETNTSTTTANHELSKIQTFVFFDLETTGAIGMDCRILELTMVAVSREDLLKMKVNQGIMVNNTPSSKRSSESVSPLPKLPRVIHKYTRLYYPRKLILPVIEDLTGLNNELLHRLPGFSCASAEALNLFLDLPKPVALVAHNGNRYDYPLLMAEMNNVLDNIYTLKSVCTLLCVDSLLAFRAIDSDLKIEEEVKEISEITSLAASFSLDDMSNDDEDEELDFEPERKKVRCKGDGDDSRRAITPPSPLDEGQLEISAELPVTPLKDQCIIVNAPKTPMKAKIMPKSPVTPEPNAHVSKVNGTSSVRRSLTYGVRKRKWDGTQPYKQVNIYKRLFGSQYDAHKSEADCIALLEICGFYSDRFVNWADNNNSEFTKVKPMWEKRKTFKIM